MRVTVTEVKTALHDLWGVVPPTALSHLDPHTVRLCKAIHEELGHWGKRVEIVCEERKDA